MSMMAFSPSQSYHTMLTEADQGFQPPPGGPYDGFTQDAATLLKGWIGFNDHIPEYMAKKRCWQIRCIERHPDHSNGGHERLRILIVTGSTSIFALTKYIAEAFGWRPAGKHYDPQPSKGVLPAGSHWTVERVNERFNAEPGTYMCGIIGSQKSVYKAAGKGAPFFHEKKTKVFQLLIRRGDTMVFRCDGERMITVCLDGCTWRDKPHEARYTPRCVGADRLSLPKATWSNLNSRYLQKKPNEPFIFPPQIHTEEDMDEMVDRHYKIPLFDNRGNAFDKDVTAPDMIRIVSLPFVED